MGIEPNIEGSGSVRFGQPDGSVRFGFGYQNLWVRSAQFEMVLEWCSSWVCSVPVLFDSHLYAGADPEGLVGGEAWGSPG